MYSKKPVSIYTAGEITDDFNTHMPKNWRFELEDYFRGVPINWNHPHYLGHTSGLHDIVADDQKFIDDSNVLIAYLNRPELYGTITEIMYAVNKLDCIIVIISSELPTTNNRHGELSTHGERSDFDNKHDYWFLENLLWRLGDKIYIITGNLTNTKIQLKSILVDFLKENGYPTTEYQAYINSDEWKQRSTDFKQDKRGVCELCKQYVGFQGLNTHHIHYPKNLKKEDNKKNWIAVCKDCHNKLHGIDSEVL